jgi:hypothetical protein
MRLCLALASLALCSPNIFLAKPEEGTGGAGKTLKEQLAAANERIVTLETRAEEADAAEVKIAQLNQTIASNGIKSAADKVLLDAAVKDKADADAAKVLADSAKSKAESDLKTADDRAETRLREISAKSGGVLPPKKGGDVTLTGSKEMTRADFMALTPGQRSAVLRDGAKLSD